MRIEGLGKLICLGTKIFKIRPELRELWPNLTTVEITGAFFELQNLDLFQVIICVSSEKVVSVKWTLK